MDAIVLQGVKTHNLKNFDLILPHRKLYVVTGVSGSGKSSLAFDTLYAEGQRRYVESLSAYARQFLERMEKPDVEMVAGIPPALAIEAKNTVNNARSTVGTQTEINDYLRVLYSRVGVMLCPDCGIEIVKNDPQTIAAYLLKSFAGEKATLMFRVAMGKKGKKYLEESLAELERQGYIEFFLDGRLLNREELLKTAAKIKDELYVPIDKLVIDQVKSKRLIDSIEQALRAGRNQIDVYVNGQTLCFSEDLKCARCQRTFREPTPNLFSFNSPLGACSECQGFGRIITIDWDLVVPAPGKTLEEGAIEPWTKPSSQTEFQQLLKFARKNKIPVDKPWNKLAQKQRSTVLFGTENKKEYFSVKDYFDYLEQKTYKMHVRVFLSKYRGFVNCPKCEGARLKPEGLAVKVSGLNIAEVMNLSIGDLYQFLETLQFSKEDYDRVEPVYEEIKKRVRFLKEVGLGYLSLARLSRTLSGGEVQRIHLASSLGSALVDTLYVLDEPSIGLHERDNYMLIRLLKELRDLGNTVIVVEHDRAMIEAADEVIDMGPLGGEKGGQLLYQGDVENLRKAQNSFTGRYLSGELEIKRQSLKPGKDNKAIEIIGAHQHNLKDVTVKIPLHQMVVVTGVSGSGKSTLLYDILYNHYLRYTGQPVQDLGAVQAVNGLDNFDSMVLIDQSPIGRTPRSNPVTYLKAFDEIRKILASTPDARREGFEAGHFSFNVDGGRCPECKGDGRIKVEMHFLADIFVPCEACQGKRFKPEILDIRFEGKNVDDILGMTVDEGIQFFSRFNRLAEKLMLLQRVGLGYLYLGQSATTLSGGEAQRLKLAGEMMERRANHIVYLFDEPTTGLHYHDIHYLTGAFDELLGRGHSLIVIEHNMEIIKNADYVIDLGPEGGSGGGELIFSGKVPDLRKCLKSFTGHYLNEYLKERGSLVRAVV